MQGVLLRNDKGWGGSGTTDETQPQLSIFIIHTSLYHYHYILFRCEDRKPQNTEDHDVYSSFFKELKHVCRVVDLNIQGFVGNVVEVREGIILVRVRDRGRYSERRGWTKRWRHVSINRDIIHMLLT